MNVKPMPKRYQKFIEAVIAEPADKSNKNIVFTISLLSSTPFPARNITTSSYVRVNGCLRFEILFREDLGCPCGGYVRILLIYIITQAKITNSKEIDLGDSYSDLFRKIGKKISGGNNGSLPAFRLQAERLFTSVILWEWSDSINQDDIRKTNKNMLIANEASFLWSHSDPKKWSSKIILDQYFFDEIQKNALPLDKRVVKAFSHYPLAFDIYCWLTFRFFNMKRSQHIPWIYLENQFGNFYKRRNHFKEKFIKALRHVTLFYPKANYTITQNKLILHPSPTHIPRKNFNNFFDTN